MNVCMGVCTGVCMGVWKRYMHAVEPTVMIYFAILPGPVQERVFQHLAQQFNQVPA